MNGELVPAALAASGGAALFGGIWAYERRREAAMRASRQPSGLRFPMALSPEAAGAALGSLVGVPPHAELLAEIVGTAGGVRHALHVPAAELAAVESLVSGPVPAVRFLEANAGTAAPAPTLCFRFSLPTPVIFRRSESTGAARSVIAALTGLRKGEEIRLTWALRSAAPKPWPIREEADAALVRAWTRETALPGFRIDGLLSLTASSPGRAAHLAERVASVVRSRQSAGARLYVRRIRNVSVFENTPRTTPRSGWLPAEAVLPLLGWPLGDDVIPGVERGSRELQVPRGVARKGRRVLVGRDAYGERDIALSPTAARHHMAVVGASGSGKSTLIGRSILDDIAGGAGGWVIDPKADLIDDVLDRVAPKDRDRIVVLDPADARPVPAIDVLGAGDPDLRTDVLVGALANIYRDSFGIRSRTYLRLGLRTLADVPGATLADLPPLFFDAAFRMRAVGRLSDPVLRAQWQGFEALSAAAQAEQVVSPITKINELISRPAVRSVLAAPRPTLDLSAMMARRQWLFVSLSPGRLGEPASQLLGAVLLYSIWSAIEGRSALAPERRRPAFLYVDELATLASLPFSLELLLERARGLGVGVTVALQSLARLPEGVRAALLTNAASLLTFRAGATEAARLARELPGLIPADLQGLRKFEVAARIGTGAGSEVAIVTGKSQPWPKRTNLASPIRERSSERYGVRADAAPLPSTDEPEPTIGRTRRQS
ncbi:MAG TPA: hypothetical protein VN238_05940 [Solirubrobacteraceae bacterium]|nr:hypothetical protein [Solirubrobacteraceae bacterium]